MLSIPTIAAGGLWVILQLYEADDRTLTVDALLAMALSFVTGFLAIAFMMAWLKRSSFTPFVVYRLILGAIVLSIAYGYVTI